MAESGGRLAQRQTKCQTKVNDRVTYDQVSTLSVNSVGYSIQPSVLDSTVSSINCTTSTQPIHQLQLSPSPAHDHQLTIEQRRVYQQSSSDQQHSSSDSTERLSERRPSAGLPSTRARGPPPGTACGRRTLLDKLLGELAE